MLNWQDCENHFRLAVMQPRIHFFRLVAGRGRFEPCTGPHLILDAEGPHVVLFRARGADVQALRARMVPRCILASVARMFSHAGQDRLWQDFIAHGHSRSGVRFPECIFPPVRGAEQVVCCCALHVDGLFRSPGFGAQSFCNPSNSLGIA